VDGREEGRRHVDFFGSNKDARRDGLHRGGGRDQGAPKPQLTSIKRGHFPDIEKRGTGAIPLEKIFQLRASRLGSQTKEVIKKEEIAI